MGWRHFAMSTQTTPGEAGIEPLWSGMRKGLLPDSLSGERIRSGRRPEVQYVGIDWAYRWARWCALAAAGEVAGEGRIAADRDGLARLVLPLGAEVKACLEVMSGA